MPVHKPRSHIIISQLPIKPRSHTQKAPYLGYLLKRTNLRSLRWQSWHQSTPYYNSYQSRMILAQIQKYRSKWRRMPQSWTK